MRIVAFAGSNSSVSINRKLVRFVLEYFSDYEINLLDLNDFEMPIYSLDREQKDGFPEEAHKFLKAIAASDAIICSLAEHNRSYSTVFKNIFDWSSRIEVKVFQGKPMFLMSTSPGGYGGGNVMEQAKKFFPQFDAQILETFSLPKFHDNFQESIGITEKKLLFELKEKIQGFQNALQK